MKQLLTIFLFLTLQITTIAQSKICDCDSLILTLKNNDTIPRFQVFMKDNIYGISFNSSLDKNYSFGVGAYLNTNTVNTCKSFRSLALETNINYHLDGYLMHNLSFSFPTLITPSLSVTSYSNFDKSSVFLRPGIGINTLIIQLSYNFNLLEEDNLNLATKHNFSLYYRLGMNKNVWKHDSSNCISQYDKRLARRRKKLSKKK